MRVFAYSTGAWSQVGADVDGANDQSKAGTSVSLSSDGTKIAIGEPGFVSGWYGSCGRARVLEYTSGAWTQVGDDMTSSFSGDEQGRAVALSGDGTRVAVGAPGYFYGDGVVRAYDYDAGGDSWSSLGWTGNVVGGVAFNGGDVRLGESVSISTGACAERCPRLSARV